MRGRLFLFDIDGTLIDSGGAGLSAIQSAVRELHGRDGPELNLAGATDSGIVREILAHLGVRHSDAAEQEFYEAYLHFLDDHLGSGEFEGEVFAGVRELLEDLREAGAGLGLLTGNIARGAAIKMRHFGLADYFEFGAYGDDHHDRNKLGPVALLRAREAHGHRYEASRTVVVGDTPKDIACGKAFGAITLCVATGSHPADELRACGADLVVEDLTGREKIVAWLKSAESKSS